MTKFYFKTILVMVLFLGSFGSWVAGQELDSKGTNFWILFQENFDKTGSLSLFITSESNANGTVEIPGLSFSEPFALGAGEITTVSIPIEAMVSGGGTVTDQGIHVVSDVEVTVYGLNQRQFSTDAFLALPVDILNVEYLAMSYTPTGNIPSQLAIVSPFDNVEVTITPKEGSLSGSIVSNSSVVGPADFDKNNANDRVEFEVKISGEYLAATPVTFTLNQGETYQLQSTSQDLTGSTIESSAPVAVFSGHQCANVPPGFSACDHMVEQIPPVTTWGSTFLTVPLATRLNGDTFRILASQNNTEIFINGELATTLDRGDFYEQVIAASSEIRTNDPGKRVLVAQYSNGQNFDGVISDPFMMIIPPAQQFQNGYTFSTPESGFSNNFVNVVALTDKTTFLSLDGSTVEQSLFQQIGATSFSGAQVPIGLGSHRVSTSVTDSTGTFGLYSYGFGSFDSYGYPGGLSLGFVGPPPPEDTRPPDVEIISLVDGTYTLRATETFTEDINGNDMLDAGEDLDEDGILDKDTGIFSISLQNNINFSLSVSFTPGDSVVENIMVSVIDPLLSASADLKVIDLVGNQNIVNLSVSIAEGFRIDGSAQYAVTGGPVQDVTMTLSRDNETVTKTIRVEAEIDGTSELILRANTAQWHHIGAAAPGRLEFNNEPTVINGTEWFPNWPDVPDAENRDCDCFSDTFSGVSPPLPETDMTIDLRIIQSRFQTSIVQLPMASNDFTLIVEFDDGLPGGSDLYIAEIDFTFVEDNSEFQMTDPNGDYLFDALEGNVNYAVTPSKDDDIGANSISCFDASLTAQHVVGLINLSPEQQKAADVDEDGNIFGFDAALTCRFAVELPPFNEIDHAGEWRFVPMSRTYEPLNSDQFDQDYMATLLGDVDGDWMPTSEGDIVLAGEFSHISFAEPGWSEDRREVTTRLYFDGKIQASSFEVDLKYDPNVLRFVEAGNVLENWQLIENSMEDGRLRLGLFSPTSLADASEFVHIKWQMLTANETTKIVIDHALVNLEVQSSVELVIDGKGVAGDVNSDGIVNVRDLISVIDFILGVTTPTDQQFAAADVNGDGVVSMNDLIAIVRIILGT